MWIYDFATEKVSELDTDNEMATRRFHKQYSFPKDVTVDDIPASDDGVRFFMNGNAGVVLAPDAFMLTLAVQGAHEALEEAGML